MALSITEQSEVEKGYDNPQSILNDNATILHVLGACARRWGWEDLQGALQDALPTIKSIEANNT